MRWSRVLLENATMILVHGVSNLMLLLPIWVTGLWKSDKLIILKKQVHLAAKNVMMRHAVHLGAGQVFPEEDEAASLLLNLSQQMPIIVVASSVLDLFLVFLFQKFLHPWRRILAAVILTRLTYNCAYLRSTKESLTVDLGKKNVRKPLLP